MVTITKAEADRLFNRLQLRHTVATRNDYGKVTGFRLFIEGRLRNPDNLGQFSGKKHLGYRQYWHRRCAPALDAALLETGWRYAPTRRKRITLHAQTWNLYDDAGLAVALKPAEDALVRAGILQDDGPESGHVITKTQERNRKERGIWITVELL